jgi:hypothetical protein
MKIFNLKTKEDLFDFFEAVQDRERVMNNEQEIKNVMKDVLTRNTMHNFSRDDIYQGLRGIAKNRKLLVPDTEFAIMADEMFEFHQIQKSAL